MHRIDPATRWGGCNGRTRQWVVEERRASPTRNIRTSPFTRQQPERAMASSLFFCLRLEESGVFSCASHVALTQGPPGRRASVLSGRNKAKVDSSSSTCGWGHSNRVDVSPSSQRWRRKVERDGDRHHQPPHQPALKQKYIFCNRQHSSNEMRGTFPMRFKIWTCNARSHL